MSLNLNKIPKTNKSKFKIDPLEAGTYPARVAQILDLGLQAQQPYQGQEKAPRYEMMVTYELVDAFMKDEDGNELEDKPRWISETFGLNPLDNDRATSTKRYMALDPSGDANGDFTALVGQGCNVTVALNVGKGKNAGKIYENIATVTALRARDLANLPELKNKTRVFTLDAPDMETFGSLPDWLKDKIKQNLEFEGSTLQKLLQGPQKGTETKTKATPQAKPKHAPTKDYDDEAEHEAGQALIDEEVTW
jgi:hypothetical protein